MRYLFLLFIVVFIITSGCYQKNNQQPSYRDIVVKDYFGFIDSSGKYSTTDLNHRILQAYIANDTIALMKIQTELTSMKKNRPAWDVWQSDIPLKKIQELGSESYRFILSLDSSSAVGDPFWHDVVTISRNDSICKVYMQTYLYDKWTERILRGKNFETAISLLQWQRIKDKIKDSKFWELNNTDTTKDDTHNYLTVFGFIKNESGERYNYVQKNTYGPLSKIYYYIYDTFLVNKQLTFATD